MKQVVLGFFPSEAEAEAAAADVRAWDKLDSEVRIEAIGILALDEKGKVKEQKLGRKTTGKGLGIGLALAALTPLGVGVVVAGGVAGALRKRDLGVKNSDRERIASELAGGRAAVGVLATSAYEAGLVTEHLRGLGAQLDSVLLSDEVESESSRVEAAQQAVTDRQSRA